MIRRLGGILLVAALLLALLPATPAQATSTYFCSGYTPCAEKGYPHFGYKRAGQQMWWQMYSGHNCTNYVAYRLVRGGMSSERPWSSTGMAYNWGHAKRGITDGKPMVGSVAWWDRNVPGAGSSGHVAFVEKVISRRRIVVSEDSWGGTFHWRRIRKAGGGWPTGFIHFNDREVRVKSRPRISGDAAVGAPLTAHTGRWSPSPRLRVQWLVAGDPVTGATGEHFTPAPAHRGKRVAIRVTASSRGYLPGIKNSLRTTRVRAGTMAVVDRPTISGTPRVGEVLEAQPASWSPSPDSKEIRWFAGGDRIRGATGQRLRLTPHQLGKRITVRVQARREGYRRSLVSSDRTAPVAPGHIEVTEAFAVGGELRMGRRLEVSPGTVAPADAEIGYTWLRDGDPIRDATRRGYELGVADVGDRIGVRVLLTRDGYRDRTIVVDAGGPVTTAADLELTPVGRPRRVVVRLRVTAPGVDTPGGRATVRIGDREVTRRLEDGRLRVVVDGVTPGTRTVRVSYHGTAVVRARTASATVHVPRR